MSNAKYSREVDAFPRPQLIHGERVQKTMVSGIQIALSGCRHFTVQALFEEQQSRLEHVRVVVHVSAVGKYFRVVNDTNRFQFCKLTQNRIPQRDDVFRPSAADQAHQRVFFRSQINFHRFFGIPIVFIILDTYFHLIFKIYRCTPLDYHAPVSFKPDVLHVSLSYIPSGRSV